MKYPQMSTSTSSVYNKSYSVVATMNGGINLHKLPSDINDNQSPDMLNMWYKNGILKTRPGIKAGSTYINYSKVAKKSWVYNLDQFEVINASAYYIPTIYTNCDSSGAGNEYEDRNFFTPWVKVKYSPGGGDKEFKLPDTNIDDKDVTIDYDWQAAPTMHHQNYTITAGSTSVTYTDPWGKTFTVTLNRSEGSLTWAYVSGDPLVADNDHWSGFTDDAKYVVQNNLVITYAKTVYTTNPISKCTIFGVFGGSLSGLGNGAYMFATGNPDEANKYYWSYCENPLYWPATNFNSCGESIDPITAIAKQGSNLIVFKKNSTYKVTYNSTEPTSTTVVYEAFPESEEHSAIGCDCPDTIELVNNCLTWLNSDGHIYRLIATTNTDENLIVSISENIESKIQSLTTAQLQSATACDTGEYYILFAGNYAFAWDYSTVAYIHYSDVEKSQLRLCWYLWYFSGLTFTQAFYYEGTIYTDQGMRIFDESVGTDLGNYFDAYVYTKEFDFGLTVYLKQVWREWFSIMCAESSSLIFLFKDDTGTESSTESITGASTDVQLVKHNESSNYTRTFQVAVKRLSTGTNSFGVDKITLIARVGHTI